jgi:PAS domain S-box-containing protein
MNAVSDQVKLLTEENERLREQLEEADQIIQAIRNNEVDAVVVSGQAGERVHIIESAARPYRLLVENTGDYAIFTLDREGCVSSWNLGAQRMLGYSESDILGKPHAITYAPEDRANDIPEQELQTALAAGRSEEDRYYLRKDGQRFCANGVTVPFYNSHGAFLGFAKIMRDLTDRLRAEEERVMLVQEAAVLMERNRMAQELHDTLAQGFTGIKLHLDVAEEALEQPASDVQEALRHIIRAREVALQSYREARSSIRALRSPLLGNATLVQALEWLAAESPGGCQVVFRTDGTPTGLSPLVENDLYRIAQEALTNALRHSGARRIVISLVYSADQVALTVQDDGLGFDPGSRRTGFGIMGIQERALRLGAALQIESRSAQGTQVTLTLPISPERKGAVPKCSGSARPAGKRVRRVR